jgi:hypothetical protein
MESRLQPYVQLIGAFANDAIDAQEFERRYLKLFKDDATDWPEREYAILDRLFGDVDSFNADPELRGPDGLDADQLRESARRALRALVAS